MLFPVPVEVIWHTNTQKEERIVQAAQKLQALETGMTMDELIELVRFVELLQRSNDGTAQYLRKEETKLARTVELEPTSGRIFIHLKTHNNVPELGRGTHKRVTKSILYDRVRPQLVATAIVQDSQETRDEIKLLEKFRDTEGIVTPLCIAKHGKKSSGRRFWEIVTPLYNEGSLHAFICKNRNAISMPTKYKIAKDILQGSSNLNAMGYLNRDNNKGNFFINCDNGIYSAVIGDIGGYTHQLKDAMKRKPLGPGLRTCPPDLHRAYYENRLTEQDLLSYHTYSVGRALYYLLFENEVPWIDGFNEKYPLIAALYKDKSNPEVVNELDRYTEVVDLHTKPRIKELEMKLVEHNITSKEEFEYYVLQMLSSDPELRRTNSYWLKIFKEKNLL